MVTFDCWMGETLGREALHRVSNRTHSHDSDFLSTNRYSGQKQHAVGGATSQGHPEPNLDQGCWPHVHDIGGFSGPIRAPEVPERYRYPVALFLVKQSE